MTAGERIVWAAVYAVFVRHPLPSTNLGHVPRAEIALRAAFAASVAVRELREFVDAAEPGNVTRDQAAEVLRELANGVV